MLRRTLFLLLVSAVSVRAHEVPISAPMYGPAVAAQYYAAAGSDGGDYLVLWSDQRTMPAQTYGTRVTRDGKVLDATGIRISANTIARPSVIWTGAAYLLVWCYGDQIRTAQISREGSIVAEERILRTHAQLSSVAGNGAVTAIAFVDTSTSEVRALSLTRDGATEVMLGSHLQFAVSYLHCKL